MKRVSLFLSGVILWSLTTVANAAGSFPDVPEDHSHFQAVEFLDERGIIKGYEDGTFKPDKLVNRAEAMKMIMLATKSKAEGVFEILFSDVRNDQWFFNFVMAAQKAGFVKGYPDGKFRPDQTVNLAETLKMLLLASHVELLIQGKDVFGDVRAGDWFSPYFVYAKEKNLVMADDYGTVSPDQKMTRANFAEIIYRLMVVLDGQGKPFPLHLNWPYYEANSVPFRMKYDPNWKVSENGGVVTFFRPDKEFGQFSAAQMFPNSAAVKVELDDNAGGKSSSQYFSNLKTARSDAKFREFTLWNRPSLELTISDGRVIHWYIYLADGNVLALFMEYGNGSLNSQLQQYVKAMLETLEYRELSAIVENHETVLSEILKLVLVEGKGMQALDTLPNKVIIETDSIGVGTGPVDYYYSAGINYSFKYERAADVILDSRSGKTSAF